MYRSRSMHRHHRRHQLSCYQRYRLRRRLRRPRLDWDWIGEVVREIMLLPFRIIWEIFALPLRALGWILKEIFDS